MTVLISVWPADAVSEVRIGATGGLARYSYSGDKPNKAAYTKQNRAAFGGLFEMDVHNGVRLSIQPSYIQKGTGISYEVEGQKERVDSVSVNTDYFSIPVLVKVFTQSERWFVSGGLEFAWLLDAKYITSSEDSDIKSDLDDFDVAVHFGIGWVKRFGRHEIFIEGRYTQSVLNVVSDSDPDGEFYGFRVKNKGILFSVGYLFNLGEIF